MLCDWLAGWGGSEFLDSFACNKTIIYSHTRILFPWTPREWPSSGVATTAAASNINHRLQDYTWAFLALCTFVLHSRIGSCKLELASLYCTKLLCESCSPQHTVHLCRSLSLFLVSSRSHELNRVVLEAVSAAASTTAFICTHIQNSLRMAECISVYIRTAPRLDEHVLHQSKTAFTRSCITGRAEPRGQWTYI